MERHNGVERGWPTETKLELSADNPFADLTTREYETLMSETGMRKPESPGAETSSREKNEDDENVFATKELKKMTVGSYAFASLGGGSSSSKTLPDDDEKDDENNDNDTSTKGVFGKVVVEQDESDHETSLENNNNNNNGKIPPRDEEIQSYGYGCNLIETVSRKGTRSGQRESYHPEEDAKCHRESREEISLD